MTTNTVAQKLSVNEAEELLCNSVEIGDSLDCGSYSVYKLRNKSRGLFILVMPISGEPCLIEV